MLIAAYIPVILAKWLSAKSYLGRKIDSDGNLKDATMMCTLRQASTNVSLSHTRIHGRASIDGKCDHIQLLKSSTL